TQDGHDQLVENLAAPFDQIQVPVGRWIKRAGIDGDDLLQRSPHFPDGQQAGKGLKKILCGRAEGWQFLYPKMACHPERTWRTGVPARQAMSSAGRARTPVLHNQTQRLAAGTLAASGGALGMVVTRAPVACAAVAVAAGWAAGTGCGAAVVNPRCLRTSASSLTKVSTLSLRNWRAFSRPWPMRSPL